MNRDSITQKKFMSPTEAAEYLGLSRLSVYRLVSAKKIPAYKPSPKKLLIKAEDLDLYVLNSPTINN